jgi:hypothetical protein
MRIRTMPTKIRDCCMYDLTPISPTIPIAYPAARPVRPTERLHETSEQAVVGAWGRTHVTSDQDGDDQGVDGDDTRHDDGDERLHDQVGSEGTDTSDTDTRLGCTECGSNTLNQESVYRADVMRLEYNIQPKIIC